MSDTVKVFGVTYTGVEGIKADDGSGNTLTFTIGGGGGSITMQDVANATGTTLVITTSGTPTPSEDIPLNTQLIDYTAVVNGYIIDSTDGTEHTQEYSCCSDFTKIDPTMTFQYIGYQWWDMAFYDESKTFISGVMQDVYKDSAVNEYATGTLTPARIPANAKYIRLSSYPRSATSAQLSLIRTA